IFFFFSSATSKFKLAVSSTLIFGGNPPLDADEILKNGLFKLLRETFLKMKRKNFELEKQSADQTEQLIMQKRCNEELEKQLIEKKSQIDELEKQSKGKIVQLENQKDEEEEL